jgi:putative transcriptional regulator
MSEVYKSIKAGLEEAIDYAKGKKSLGKEFRPIPIDVKGLRERLGMSQNKFAESFGISLGTLRHWERGDRNPQGPALVLLNLVSKEPKTVLKLLYK